MAKEAKHKTIEENSNRGRKRVAYAVLIFLTFACLIWFVMLFLLTTQSHGEQFGSFKFMIGKSFFDNISGALNTQNMIRGMINSVIISGSCAILGVYFSTLTAYAIHAYDFKLKNAAFTFILAVMMVPTQVTVLGFVDLLRFFDLTENYTGLIVPSIAAPVTFYYIKQYMESALPLSLVEAARIDGSGEFRTFNSIVLPLMKPAIAVQAIFAFVGQWNNYFVPSQIIIEKRELKTVALLIASLRSADWKSFNLGHVNATIFLSILPVIVIYLILSKNIVGGLALGSVKG
ncbi:MAG: carbohydrate ABC transporter permease [Lachnospiraceae bacterium]|nr:carbohydrate ABC transporter permease [Lachnospiraceae bacterium]